MSIATGFSARRRSAASSPVYGRLAGRRTPLAFVAVAMPHSVAPEPCGGRCVDLAAMSFLGRLFGRADPAPAPPANSVVIADDLAAALTAEGRPLADAVDAALREQLTSRRRDPDARVPFWLARDAGQVDIE